MPVKATRDITQGRQSQGTDEEIIYSLTTTAWGSDPSDESISVYDLSDGGTDVTADVTSGSSSIAGDVITLPTIENLTAGRIYQVEVQFTAGGSVFEAPFIILCAGFTYLGDLSTDRDKARFYIGDTDPSDGPIPGGSNFSDGEIDGLITAEGSWQRAVAGAFETLAAQWGQYVDTAVGPRREQLSQTAERYTKLAAEWRKRHGSTASAGVRHITRVDGYSDDVAANEV